MPSTKKQKAKEKRSRQSDVMSDIENLDVMLGSYEWKTVKCRIELKKMKLTQSQIDEKVVRIKMKIATGPT